MTTRSIELQPFTRALTVSPESVNVDERTVEVVWSTGALVRRYSWAEDTEFEEELVLSGARLDLMNNRGVPFLDAHDRWSTEAVFGRTVLNSAKVENGEGRALVRFSKRDRAQEVLEDIRDGILPEVSIGYRIFKVERIQRKDKIPLWRIVDWEPYEVSTVPIAADGGAGFRAEKDQARTRAVMEEPMSTSAAPQTPPQPTRDEPSKEEVEKRAAQRAQAEERERVRGIMETAKKLGISPERADSLISDGTMLSEARPKMIDWHAEDAPTTRMDGSTRVEGGRDEKETAARGWSEALRHRCDPDRVKLTDNGKRFMYMGLLDMARHSLAARGINADNMPPARVATRALEGSQGRVVEYSREGELLHTTADFPLILADAMNKSMRTAYLEQSSNWRPWCKQGTARDFKEINTYQMSEMEDLEEVNEAGEYKYGSLSESKESYRVVKRGKILGINFEAIVNDDLGAFTRAMSFGAAAERLEADIVWGILTANPTMGDSVALFHASHGSNLAAGTNRMSPNLNGIKWARVTMGKQVGPKGKAKLGLRLRFVLVPLEEELAAQQVLASITAATTSDAVPESYRQHVVIADQRLSDPKAWYGVADPRQIDTIQYAYLQGYEGVSSEMRIDFNTDGIQMKARHIFGAKALDWRAFVKNPNDA